MTADDAFTRRIARLESEWRACGRVEPLRELHTAAVDLTNDARRVLDELRHVASDESAAFEEFEQRHSTILIAEANEIVAEDQSLGHQLAVEPPGDRRVLLEARWNSTETRAATMKSKFRQFELLRLNRAQEVEKLRRLESVLLDGVVGPEIGAFSLEAVKSAFALGVGILLPPLGATADVLQRLYDLDKRHEIRAATAGAYVKYLVDYAAAIRHWIERARLRITVSIDNPY
jgi:hypothetical protein